MYDLPASQLVANPLNRYLINSPMLPHLKRDADGGLTIYLQDESPGGQGSQLAASAGGVLNWAVFAPTAGRAAGALAGDYVGASGDIGLGVGVGANVLLGGSGRTVALQPVSLEGSVSVNVALGVSALHLRPAF